MGFYYCDSSVRVAMAGYLNCRVLVLISESLFMSNSMFLEDFGEVVVHVSPVADEQHDDLFPPS
jgi:hypothetical protein